MTNDLTSAIVLATYSHDGQQYTLGGGKSEPYILHPLRVMLYFEDDTHRMVSVLHDVVEDTHITIDMLRESKYPKEVIEAVDAITRKEGETYKEYIQRCKKDRIARAVKMVDLLENLKHKPIGELEERYAEALRILEANSG